MKMNIDRVPKNLDEALEILEAGLEPDDRAFIEREDTPMVHFTFGMWLRNNWSLWEKEMPLASWFRGTLGLGHPDDMSGIILDSLWRKVRGKPVDLPGQVLYYKKFWESQGIDPLTQQECKGV